MHARKTGAASVAVFAAALVVSMGGCSEDAPVPEVPGGGASTVVVIVIDTLRADGLAPYGAARETSPFLAELADRSLVFESAWSTSSWTAPATASLFTSLYPFQHGVITGLRTVRGKLAEGDGESERLNRLPRAAETLPQMMRAAGYRTFGITANPNIGSDIGFDRGFDRFHGFHYDTAQAVNAKLREWTDEIDAADKAFVYLHYMDPHQPYHMREPWFEPSPEAQALLERIELEPAGDDPRADRIQALNPKKLIAEMPPRDELRGPLFDLLRAAYDSEIRYLDDHLREVFELLPLESDAVVIVTSDHGEEFGDHGRVGHSFQLYSELTRVPMLLHVADEGPTGRVDVDASIVDVLPTLRQVARIPSRGTDQGRSLYELADPAADVDRPLLASRTQERASGASPVKQAVQVGDLRLIRSLPDGRQELYDRSSDPAEIEDLAERRPDDLARLTGALSELERTAPRHEREFLEDFTLDSSDHELLEKLGYTGD